MLKKNLLFSLALTGFVSLPVHFAFAQAVIYPAKGQSAEQQKTDQAECGVWAVENSAYDPANPPAAQAAAQPKGPTGSRLRGAAGGALIAGITDNDKSDAAAVGAIIGGSSERRQRRRSAGQAQTTATQQQQDGLAKYNNSLAACLEGRGYSVK